MKLHANAPLGPRGRSIMVSRVLEQGWSVSGAASAAGVSDRTCWKWLARFRKEGELGLVDRSSEPVVVANRTDELRVQAIAAIRRLRFTGPEIAEILGMPLSTVSGILKRVGMGKLGRLGLEPAVRYERSVPGELIHIDVKKLGRIGRPGHRVLGQRARAVKGDNRSRYDLGWEFVHIAIDDATRLAYVEVLEDEKALTAVAFLRRAITHFASYGITVQGLITDNGNAYRSAVHAIACRSLGVRHLGRGLIAPKPTGRQSASSARCSAAGPTARSTATAPSATLPSSAGSTSTIADDHIAPSTTSHPSLAYTS
jgi:transposase